MYDDTVTAPQSLHVRIDAGCAAIDIDWTKNDTGMLAKTLQRTQIWKEFEEYHDIRFGNVPTKAGDVMVD